jgi:hypothetical protein
LEPKSSDQHRSDSGDASAANSIRLVFQLPKLVSTGEASFGVSFNIDRWNAVAKFA